MTQPGLTHKDLADSLGVSETTIKSYRRKFPGCIPVASDGKPIRFTESALIVTTRIRDYFYSGMSVEEVRLRLSNEFSWISPKTEQSKSIQENTSEKSVSDVSQSMSSMAKSMVTVAQKQNLIIKKMDFIESQLKELGLKGFDGHEIHNAISKEKKEKETFLESRLEHIDMVAKQLAQMLSSITDRIDIYFNRNRDNVIESNNVKEEKSETPESSVVQFQSINSQQKDYSKKNIEVSDEDQGPPRQFYAYPLVVHTAEGKYISAGGRGRGRFSLNDLKAVLIYGTSTIGKHSIQWEQNNDCWIMDLTLTSPKDESIIYTIFFVELFTQKLGNVLEIVELKKDRDQAHPVEICSIIGSFTE